jgi:uncharacterized protein involved in type VI secretion and phage assembly
MDDLALLERTARQQETKYYGKYRAFVVDNKDPDKRGRVTLSVPSVLGEATTTWALPCLPYGGGSDFGFVAVPPVGAQVLAEFMEGDVSTPLWTGTFWRTSSEVPAEFAGGDEPTVKVMKTESGHLLTFEDKNGDEAIVLQSAKQAKIEMDSKGSIVLNDSKGSKVTLDADGNKLTIEDANGNSLELSSSGFTLKDLNGNEVSGAASGITVKSTTVQIQGQMVQIGGSGGEPLIKGTTFLAMFNAHTHNCTAPGAPSGPPVPPLTPTVLSTAATTT